VTAVATPGSSVVGSAAPGPRARAGAGSIELRDVSKRYGDHVALHPLDLHIQAGEFFCLLGPSGCGKTTTLNLIGGFVRASTGEILIEGTRANDIPPHKRNVNTVFQNYALFPHLSVRNNVGFGLKMARVPRRDADARVDEALQLVGLEQYAERFPSQLSGGQQQRVAVARALVNRPAVLLLDEPLGALDLKLRKRLQVELAQIHREVGTTFVFVTHDQEEAMAMADRIAVMNEGHVEQVGSARDIYTRPASRFVAGFIGESNFIAVECRDGVALTARGGIPLPAPDGAENGRATLMVRPESVRLAPAQPEDGGLIGRIVKLSFLGNFVRASIECSATDDFLVVDMSTEPSAGIREGESTRLRWEADAAVLFREDNP